MPHLVQVNEPNVSLQDRVYRTGDRVLISDAEYTALSRTNRFERGVLTHLGRVEDGEAHTVEQAVDLLLSQRMPEWTSVISAGVVEAKTVAGEAKDTVDAVQQKVEEAEATSATQQQSLSERLDDHSAQIARLSASDWRPWNSAPARWSTQTCRTSPTIGDRFLSRSLVGRAPRSQRLQPLASTTPTPLGIRK